MRPQGPDWLGSAKGPKVHISERYVLKYESETNVCFTPFLLSVFCTVTPKMHLQSESVLIIVKRKREGRMK